MGKRELFQAIEDRNPKEVEALGPFKCTRGDAWLGEGWYFWDSLEEDAHWWGRNAYKNGYIICHSSCDNSMDGIYDLLGEPKIIAHFKTARDVVKQKLERETVFVSEVIEYLKLATDFSKEYFAIRCTHSKKRLDLVPFDKIGKHFLLLSLNPVQLCFLDLNHFTDPYKIIYPLKYCEDRVM